MCRLGTIIVPLLRMFVWRSLRRSKSGNYNKVFISTLVVVERVSVEFVVFASKISPICLVVFVFIVLYTNLESEYLISMYSFFGIIIQ